MQLSFDPRDPNACASVIATINALHGESAYFGEGGSQDSRLLPDALDDRPSAAEGGSQDSRLLPDALDDRPSAAEAFDAPNPEAAFAAPLAAGVAPIAAPSPQVASPAVASPPNPGGVPVDTRGFPWDSRIHSGPANKKPTNADGTWRKGRGVTDEQIAAVESELRAVMGAPAPLAAAPEVAAVPIPPAPPAVPIAAPTPPAPAVAVPTAAPIVPAPTPAVAVAEPGPVAATPAADFASLMRKITGLQTSGHLTVEGTAQISASLGITGVRDLMTRPDLIPSFDALLPVAA